MNSYEITIYGIKDDAEMNEIQNALHAAGVTDAGDGESGMYLQYGKSRSVFVDPMEVSEAVDAINALGYTTDEDEVEEIED